MKHLLVPSFLLLAVTGNVSWAQSPNPIQRLVLDPLTVVHIPVALDRLTTVRLPSPPSDVESARAGTEPHPDALFLLSIQPGSPSFSVRAVVPNTNTTLNVSWKGQTYVFDLFESRQPWLSVTFDAPREASPHATGGGSRGGTPARLLGLLDTAKAYGLLRQQHPAAVADVEVVRPDTLRDYGNYTIRTEEVFRFDSEDTLVFRIGISNKTSAPLQFIPESLMVRAGTRIYYQSITEATGVVPPHAYVPVYFAVTGSPDGSRNALSPKNDFMILLQRIETETIVSAPAPGQQSAVPPPHFTPPANSVASERGDGSPAALKTLTSPFAPAPAPPVRGPAVPASWQPLSPPAATPPQVFLFPPVYQMPAPVRPSPFAFQTPAPSPTVAGWPAQSARDFVDVGRSRGPSSRSGRSFEWDGGIIGISIHIGGSSQ